MTRITLGGKKTRQMNPPHGVRRLPSRPQPTARPGQHSSGQKEVRPLKTKLFALSSLFLLSSLGAAGCTITPNSYSKAAARVTCRTIKKCEEEAWDLAGYDKVSDCADDLVDDDFADNCDDYDRGEARKCLRSARKAKRSCETDDLDLEACAKVCGTIEVPGMGELTPEETGRFIAEAKFAAGEITEQDLEDELAEAEFASEIEAEEEALLQEEIDAVFAEED